MNKILVFEMILKERNTDFGLDMFTSSVAQLLFSLKVINEIIWVTDIKLWSSCTGKLKLRNKAFINWKKKRDMCFKCKTQ